MPSCTILELSFKASQVLSSINNILNIHPVYFKHLCPACYEKATRDVMETRSLWFWMGWDGGKNNRRFAAELWESHSRSIWDRISSNKALCIPSDSPESTWQIGTMRQECVKGFRTAGPGLRSCKATSRAPLDVNKWFSVGTAALSQLSAPGRTVAPGVFWSYCWARSVVSGRNQMSTCWSKELVGECNRMGGSLK